MSSVPIDLEITTATKDLLGKLKKHAGAVSLKNSFRVIGISYRKEVKAIFNRKQVRDPDLKWPALSKKTLAEKKRLGYGSEGILVRSGLLKRSMTVKGSKGNISSFGHDFGQFGSSIEYGGYHDNLDEARKKMPLRNFSQPSESTYGSWLATMVSDLNAQLKRAGVYV